MQPGMKKPVMESLRTDPFLARMACWLCANKVYSPGLRIFGTSLEYPVSQPDIADLLAGLHEFMSPDLVFDVDLSENLKPESVARAFILVNFTQPREERKIRGADLVYSTNRGELFCRKAEKGLTHMAESPLRFIAENTGLKPGPKIQIKFFHPAKSLCPRINYGE